MRDQKIDAYIIPAADPHISEYLPAHYQCIAYVSGFTGSAGTLVVTQAFAGLWTDSRYFVQAKEQLKESGFELVKLKVQKAPEYIGWLSETLDQGSTVAFDGKLIAVTTAKEIINFLQPRKMIINARVDLLKQIWSDRPSLPRAEAYLIPPSITGENTKSKLDRVRQYIVRHDATAHLISSLDDIAWLYNIRGADVKCNPVVLSFSYITVEKAYLFIDKNKLHLEAIESLETDGVELKPYEDIFDFIRLLNSDETIFVDPVKTCYTLYTMIPQYDRIIKGTNPTTQFKAIKNEVETAHTRQTMVKDGVALTKFFMWFEEQLNGGLLDELSIVDQLFDFRSQQESFVNDSFDTIAAYGPHAALPHYKPTADSNSNIGTSGLFLLDSGGQYKTGTTDITRVVPCGPTNAEETKDYTLVLKSLIEGSTILFPESSRGYQIDAITRKALWDHLYNYGHGTGHGVGFFLNVHEGPQVFNPSNNDTIIEENMITSIEPGLYREGRHGIRIENLVLSKDAGTSEFGNFMGFETLSLCYIDTSLIEKELLEQKHLSWLNEYHQQVYDALSPYLNEKERQWLKEKTKNI